MQIAQELAFRIALIAQTTYPNKGHSCTKNLRAPEGLDFTRNDTACELNLMRNVGAGRYSLRQKSPCPETQAYRREPMPIFATGIET
jgi:hypothetical protein